MEAVEATVLAIDIGTTRTKVARYRRVLDKPEMIGSPASAPTAGIDPEGTVDVTVLIEAVLELVRVALVESADTNAEIRTVGITSFLSHVLLDYRGAVIGPVLSWSFRPVPEAIAACTRACEDARYRPERSIGTELLAPRLVHLSRCNSDVARATARVITLKDLVRATLAGDLDTRTIKVDWSVRDYSLMRDRRDRPIDPILSLLRAEGFLHPEEILPPSAPAHHVAAVLAEAPARRLGLSPGTPLVLGSTDGTAAMYGGGVAAEEKTVGVFGTTDVVMRARPVQTEADPSDHPPAGLSRNACVLPGYDLAGGSTSASGTALRWMQDLLARPQGWESVPPGAEGVMIAPGFTGERAPWNAPAATGAIRGLTLEHGGAHLARALREAQLFRVRMLVECVSSGSAPIAILAGGGNRSEALDRLRSTILPWPIQWRQDPELSLCGTAIFALAALAEGATERDTVLRKLCIGASRDVERVGEAEGILRRTMPETAVRRERDIYEHLYGEWRRWIADQYGVRA